MRALSTLMICAVALGSFAGRVSLAQQPVAQTKPGFTLTTTAFEDGGIIPTKYTSAAPSAVSPKLEWTNVPENTVSFALIVHDPDVAVEKRTEDALHWGAFNIPGTAHGLPEGVPPAAQLPDGTIQLKVIRGIIGFIGPGARATGPYHHYTFEVYALDTKLDLGADATRADVLRAINGHILGKAVLVGRFHR
jgi:Raf kinase inhibitor-like YbhB/YbcL family protein